MSALQASGANSPPPSNNSTFFKPISERDACITAIALTFIALFLLIVAGVLFGIGSMDPTQNMGLGAFAYLGGTLLSFTALGNVVGAIGFGGYSLWQNQKKGDKCPLPLIGNLC